VTAEELEAAFPDWTIGVGGKDLLWHAWLRTTERPVPHLAARTLEELAQKLNNFIGGTP
jgi:hypothetical protein